jgi:hypothetical protein
MNARLWWSWLVVVFLAFTSCLLQAADEGITDAKDLLEGVNRQDLRNLQYPNDKDFAEALKRVDAKVQANAKGKSATFKVTLRSIQKEDSYVFSGESEPMRSGSGIRYFSVGGMLDDADSAKAAKLKPGDKVTVTGTLARAGVMGTAIVMMRADFEKAKLK